MIVEDVTGGRVGGASVGGFVSKFSGLGVGMGRASVYHCLLTALMSTISLLIDSSNVDYITAY